MPSLEDKLAKIRKQERKVLEEIAERDKKKKIKCSSCDSYHNIGILTAVQTYDYVPPSGCTDGGYYVHGELQFICPKTEVRNRLLFLFDKEMQSQFIAKYNPLFKEIKKFYDPEDYNCLNPPPFRTSNNHYVERHPKNLDLQKRAKTSNLSSELLLF